jgi:predicted phosphoadenosine phosphosulfate sulfurtransferase
VGRRSLPLKKELSGLRIVLALADETHQKMCGRVVAAQYAAIFNGRFTQSGGLSLKANKTSGFTRSHLPL